MHPLVMGIVNVTPDSFSDGGAFATADEAIAHGRRLITQGADVLDIGGESSRPGADPVPAEDEADRVLPVIEALADDVRVSIDTTKASVAAAAVEAGASLINDITASLHDVAAERGVGFIAVHMQGRPQTMQADPTYDDVVAEVQTYLADRAGRAAAAGVSEVWIDPGIGFGKTMAHNWALLAALPELVAAGWPVAIGTSRKAFLGAILGQADGTGTASVEDRLDGSVATVAHAAACGVGMVRVHDVAATVGALRAVAA